VLYLCDTAVAPLDLYRTLASEIGLRPSHRSAQLWTDIKKALLHMVDERGSSPVIILDEAQHLSDSFLVDLSGFLNFAFDSRDLVTLWQVGLPALGRHLRMQIHAPLAMRVVYQVHLEPLDRELFAAMLDHGLAASGATQSVLADPARELLFRASRGVPRVASNLLRRALREAHERNQSFIDDNTMEAAIDASPAVQALAG
jgi:type II secretory pathway predicted ATPase ExeA